MEEGRRFDDSFGRKVAQGEHQHFNDHGPIFSAAEASESNENSPEKVIRL
jgi:hypothetical protein